MKHFLITLSLAIAATCAQSQTTPPQGNWVIESNVKTPKLQTVKFYDAHDKLIYEETVYKKLRVSRAGVRKRLNNTLAQILTTGSPTGGVGLLASWK